MQRVGVEGLVPKVRKRGCSSPSSASSIVHSYRFKRAIVVGKGRHGLGRSRSNTPVPTWRTTPFLRGAGESPGTLRPVSARKLAATLWEMNEVPSPAPEGMEEVEVRGNKKAVMKKEKMRSASSHLCDPSHSPVSERMDRSGTGSDQKRMSTSSHRTRTANHNVGVLDSLSSASLVEMETRSQTSVSVGGVKNRLKDVSTALTTSKELLKIINRIWARSDPPSSSMSLVSALHAELERARLQVNQLIQEQRSDQNEISYLMKCFAEGKAAWKSKEKKAIESAIESIANELEAERKLRRRSESLNKKLGKELLETKASFTKAVKMLENEKRAREIIEQTCSELAGGNGEDRGEIEDLNRESAKIHEEIKKERVMLQLADRLCEERVHMKLSDAKHEFEDKNSAVNKLRKQLDTFLVTKSPKVKGNGSANYDIGKQIAAYLNGTRFNSYENEEKDDSGEVVECGEDSAESELHSIELNVDNTNKNDKWAYPSGIARESSRVSVDEIKTRSFVSGQVPRRSTSLLRSTSDVIEWGTRAGYIQNSEERLDPERLHELGKLGQKYGYLEEIQRLKAVAGLRDHSLTTARKSSGRDVSSPSRHWEQLRDPCGSISERSSVTHGDTPKSRLADFKGEGQSARRAKRRE
nr:golgin family A protein [Ipomoea batatas]